MGDATDRTIGADERTGVLEPANLTRFRARWYAPAPGAAEVVDTYWSVAWDLGAGESLSQRILELPAITFSVESGDGAPAPLVITPVQRRAWVRTIAGRGQAFGVRLRPAGLRVVSDLVPTELEAPSPVTPHLDRRAHMFLAAVAQGGSDTERVGLADAAVHRLVEERPLSPEQRLANAVVDALTARVRARTGAELAVEVAASERAVQRALRHTLGIGPKAAARRIRLQEVVRLLSQPGATLAQVATDLGYVDQAHLVNDFRPVAGLTPGRYVRQLGAPSTGPDSP